MRFISNYVPVLAKILYASISKIVQEIRTAHKAYLEILVSVVGVVKKHHSAVEAWDLL